MITRRVFLAGIAASAFVATPVAMPATTNAVDPLSHSHAIKLGSATVVLRPIPWVCESGCRGGRVFLQ